MITTPTPCEVAECHTPATKEDFVNSGRFKISVCDEHYAEKHGDTPNQSDDLDQKVDELFADIARSYDEQTVWQVCTKVKALMRANAPKAQAVQSDDPLRKKVEEITIANVKALAEAYQAGKKGFDFTAMGEEFIAYIQANYIPKAQSVQDDDWIDKILKQYSTDVQHGKAETGLGVARAAIQAQLDAAYQRGRIDGAKTCEEAKRHG